MATGILGISITGLNAAMAALRTTQHNIANANTPGFHRQALQLVNNPPSFSAGGLFGNGVAIAAVTRLYSQFLDNELMRSQGQLAGYEVYAAYAQQVDRLLGDQNSGIASALSAFFASVNEVANDPTSIAAREAMLAAARNLAGRMNNLGAGLDSMLQGLNGEMAAMAQQVNAYVRQIADLNDRIALLEAMAGGTANDLLDQREQLTAELNKWVEVRVQRGGDGSFNLYLGGGQPLLVGNQPNLVGVSPDPFDTRLISLTLTVGAATFTLDSQLVRGGRLGGALALREEVLLPALQELGRLAVALTDRVNALHQNGEGIDTPPSTGLAFFRPVNSLLHQPMAHAGNSGTATITAALTNSNQLTGSAYLLSFDGTDYTLTRLSDGASSTGGLTAVTTIAGQPQGFTLTATGTPSAGDRWLIRLTDTAAQQFALQLTDPRQIAAAYSGGGPGDNRMARDIAALQTSKTLTNGTTTFAGHYAQLVARTASLANEAAIAQQAAETLARQAFESQQALSGVNLDEEAANLIRYQQAYQAAARAMEVASRLFDELLALGR